MEEKETMKREQAVLLTIVAERILEEPLKELVEKAGAHGYSIIDTAYGKGTHGVREGTGPGSISSNIQMNLAVPKETAEAILSAVENKYAQSYAIRAFLQPVEMIHWTPR